MKLLKFSVIFFQYIYINEYLIRNIFDVSMNSFIYTAVKNFQKKYKMDNILVPLQSLTDADYSEQQQKEKSP